MSFRVVITEQAEREMQSAFDWWAEHRSKGRRPTHRAVFTIRGEEVVVLTVRHVAQPDLSPDDIAS